MQRRLEGKRCFITAAAQGIGRATALAFARAGAWVVASDIDARGLEALKADDPSLRTEVVDVTDERALLRGIEATGPLDVLFNCAGWVHQGSILDCSVEDWRRSFQINVDSMFLACKAALPGMLANRRGSIINMASVASSVKGVPRRAAYGATKAAVIGMTKAMAADFVGYGIRCNAICPGTVQSPSLAERVVAMGGDREAAWRAFTDRQPMGRLGDPVEIAALALHLASDESSFTTGQIHIVDGGWSN
jgi:2-keto-3-deoxy-L-fuconate dehydrogenase